MTVHFTLKDKSQLLYEWVFDYHLEAAKVTTQVAI